jgi:hypothetical protein
MSFKIQKFMVMHYSTPKNEENRFCTDGERLQAPKEN